MTTTLAPTGPYVTPRRAPAAPVAPAYGRRRVVAAGLLVGLLAVGGVVAHDVLAGPGGVPASAAGASRHPPASSWSPDPATRCGRSPSASTARSDSTGTSTR